MKPGNHPLLSTPEWQQAVTDQNAGRFEQAEARYLVMTRSAPDCPELYCNLAILANLKGNYGVTLAFASHAATLATRWEICLFLAGNALVSAGRVADAVTTLRRAVSINPKNAEGYFHLGNALNARSLDTEAEAIYRKGLKLNPDYSEIWLNLGNILREERPEEALEAFRRSAEIQPDYAFAHNNIGNVLRDLDRLAEAETAYRAATQLASDYDAAFFNLGNALRDQGKIEEASESFRRAVAINPLHGDAHRHLAITAKLKPADPDIVAMRQVFDDPDTPPRERMYMAFGLGFVHDKARDHKTAFQYFDTGNRINRSTLNYSPDNDKKKFDKLRSVCNAAFFAADQPCGSSEQTPILIVGMMRSGTSLMEQILACHSQVEGAGELLVMPRMVDPPDSGVPGEFPSNQVAMNGEQWDRLGQDYCEQVRARLNQNKPFFTDKLPQNFLYLGSFARALPKTRVIHMVRNPLDVCLSIYSTMFTTGHPYAYNLEELGRYYVEYHRMMQHWHEVIPGMILDVSYGDLVDDTRGIVQQVLDYLNLPFEQGCMDFHKSKRAVKTASALQVREKIYKSSVARWRKYETELKVLANLFEAEGIDTGSRSVLPSQ